MKKIERQNQRNRRRSRLATFAVAAFVALAALTAGTERAEAAGFGFSLNLGNATINLGFGDAQAAPLPPQTPDCRPAPPRPLPTPAPGPSVRPAPPRPNAAPIVRGQAPQNRRPNAPVVGRTQPGGPRPLLR